MAIKTVDSRTGETKLEHVGRVLKVHEFMADRDMSDTLDYSDWQNVKCTQALVYFGRTVPADHEGYFWLGSKIYHAGEEIPLMQRFGWVDVSNHFSWRGEPFRTAEPDNHLIALDGALLEDYELYQAESKRLHDEAVESQRLRDLAEQARKQEEERNRPVVGKQMVVFKGRKVPVGTIGTVAYIHSNGGVLLKADNEWRNRKADGVWVNPGNLKAR